MEGVRGKDRLLVSNSAPSSQGTQSKGGLKFSPLEYKPIYG